MNVIIQRQCLYSVSVNKCNCSIYFMYVLEGTVQGAGYFSFLLYIKQGQTTNDLVK